MILLSLAFQLVQGELGTGLGCAGAEGKHSACACAPCLFCLVCKPLQSQRCSNPNQCPSLQAGVIQALAADGSHLINEEGAKTLRKAEEGEGKSLRGACDDHERRMPADLLRVQLFLRMGNADIYSLRHRQGRVARRAAVGSTVIPLFQSRPWGMT